MTGANPKSEIRNPKQIQITKQQMTETPEGSHHDFFWAQDFVSAYGTASYVGRGLLSA